MAYKILSFEKNEELEKIMEQIQFLLKTIYTSKEKKDGHLFKTRMAIRLLIWKDHTKKVCFVVESNCKKYQFPTMLKKTYGDDAIIETELSTEFVEGRAIIAANKLYPLHTADKLEDVVRQLPKHTMIAITLSKAIEPIAYKIKGEEQSINRQNKECKSDLFAQKGKALKPRIGEDKYFFEADMVVYATKDAGKKSLVNLANSLNFIFESEFNNLRLKRFPNHQFKKEVAMQHVSKIHMTLDEATNILAIPTREKVGDNVYLAKEEVEEALYNEGIVVGTHTRQDGRKIEIRLPLKLLTKHLFLTGATGGGKSAELLKLLDEFILTLNMENGYTIFDPKEETLHKIINHLLYFESLGYDIKWNKVHYIDLADPTYAPSLNLFNIPTKQKDIDKFQENLMELFNAVYKVGDTPRMDKMLRNMIGTLLLEKDKQNTIIDAGDLLQSEDRQKEAQRNLGNGYYERMYKSFWDNPPKPSEIDSIMSRINMFQTPQMQRLYGLPEFDLRIRKWMDEGHIVLINTKGLDEQKTRLNVGHLLAQYTMVAMERPTTGAKEHPIIFDEGKQTQLPIIEDKMIPILRGFGVPVIFCTQTIKSIKTSLADEISENVQTVISARLGDEGSKKLSKMMNGRVAPSNFQNLPDLHLLLSTQNKKKQFQTIEIEVEPPYWYYKKEDGSWKIAEFHDEQQRAIEESFAGYQAVRKINELQKRDWRHKDEIDKLLEQKLSHFKTTDSTSESDSAKTMSDFFKQ